MPYVLGALLGDGCAYHWGNHFQIWLVGEEEFTEKFARKLSSCLQRKVKHYRYGSKNAWFVRVDNAELFFLFRSVRKDHSLIGMLVEEIGPLNGWREFVEGFFDAEGCIKFIRGAERRTPKPCLDFCNTDLGLLHIIQTAMRETLGMESGISTQQTEPSRRTTYHLRIYSRAGIARFFDIMSTTKLSEEKKLLLDAWITKRSWGKLT